jgi:hypothetical protein
LQSRRERLAMALRANLKRRKTHARIEHPQTTADGAGAATEPKAAEREPLPPDSGPR